MYCSQNSSFLEFRIRLCTRCVDMIFIYFTCFSNYWICSVYSMLPFYHKDLVYSDFFCLLYHLPVWWLVYVYVQTFSFCVLNYDGGLSVVIFVPNDGDLSNVTWWNWVWCMLISFSLYLNWVLRCGKIYLFWIIICTSYSSFSSLPPYPDWLCGPPSLLYSGYWGGSFPGSKAPGVRSWPLTYT
jgi:hypothetical protein